MILALPKFLSRIHRRYFYLRHSLLFFVLFPFSIFSDDANIGNCSLCCGWVEDNEGEYQIYQPGTSCVRMSSVTCSEIRDGLEDSIESIEQQVNYIVETWSSSFRSTFSDALQSINMQIVGTIQLIQETHNNISDLDSNLNVALQSLQAAVAYNDQSVSYYSTIGTGILVVSNLSSGVQGLFPRAYNPLQRTRSLTNYLASASSAVQLASSTNQVVSSNVSDIRSSINSIQESVMNLSSVVDAQLQQLDANLSTISSATQASRQYLESMNCSSCGQNTAGGGTAGGGGSTTLIDLTPVVNAINQHRSVMKDCLDQLKELINDFFTDYSNARISRVQSSGGRVTDSIYRSSDNWLHRMETLLYAVASPNFSDDSVDDYSPDSESGISSLMEDNESKSATTTNEVNAASVDRQGSVLYRLKNCVEDLYDSFSFLRVSSASLSGGFGDSGISVGDFRLDPLHIDSDVANSLDFVIQLVRYCFQAFYYIVAVLSLFGFFLLCFRAVRKCVEVQLQLYASLFGSSG